MYKNLLYQVGKRKNIYRLAGLIFGQKQRWHHVREIPKIEQEKWYENVFGRVGEVRKIKVRGLCSNSGLIFTIVHIFFIRLT